MEDLPLRAPFLTFVVGAEFQHDDVRGSQGYGTFEFRYAFGGDRAKGVRRDKEERWTDRRMVSRVVRDIDIVTAVPEDPVGEAQAAGAMA